MAASGSFPTDATSSAYFECVTQQQQQQHALYHSLDYTWNYLIVTSFFLRLVDTIYSYVRYAPHPSFEMSLFSTDTQAFFFRASTIVCRTVPVLLYTYFHIIGDVILLAPYSSTLFSLRDTTYGKHTYCTSQRYVLFMFPNDEAIFPMDAHSLLWRSSCCATDSVYSFLGQYYHYSRRTYLAPGYRARSRSPVPRFCESCGSSPDFPAFYEHGSAPPPPPPPPA